VTTVDVRIGCERRRRRRKEEGGAEAGATVEPAAAEKAQFKSIARPSTTQSYNTS
jgi:hypothetical protein